MRLEDFIGQATMCAWIFFSFFSFFSFIYFCVHGFGKTKLTKLNHCFVLKTRWFYKFWFAADQEFPLKVHVLSILRVKNAEKTLQR